MNAALRVAVAVVVTGMALAALAALSRAPYREPGADEAVLRLSWRVRGIRVQECRSLTPEELAALPPHMRRPEVCEGRIAPYRLRVRVDGRVLADTLVHAAGAREDRPVYVFREFRVLPGVHRVDLRFVREAVGQGGGEGGGEGGDGEREWRDEAAGRDEDLPRERRERHGRADERGGRNGESPARLELEARVDLEPGDVALITYDPQRRALVLRRGE
ncbi:MAG TPA: hypothetical protein VF192_14350 [Longimicrobiales bacterium]